MAPPGQSSAQTRRNTLSTRAWALSTRLSPPCLWSRAYRYKQCRFLPAQLSNLVCLLWKALVWLKCCLCAVEWWWRRCHVGADGTEFHTKSAGLVWRRGGGDHVQVHLLFIFYFLFCLCKLSNNKILWGWMDSLSFSSFSPLASNCPLELI